MTRPAHFPALDGLRGLAILMVIAHNVQMMDGQALDVPAKVFFMAYNFGWVGVQLFFVLSGFLITGILIDTLGQPHALRNFIARRALRIFPLYYGVLLLIFVVLPALGLQPAIYQAQAHNQIWLWTYLSNWTDPLHHGAEALPHFWSLAVEEQFYLFWPLLVMAAGSAPQVAKLSLGVAFIGLASRAAMMSAGVDHEFIYSATVSRVDALALGALVAACWRMPEARAWFETHARQVAAGVTLLVAVAAAFTHEFPRTSPRGMVVGFGVLAIAFAAMVAFAALRDARRADGGGAARDTLWHRRILSARPLRQVGKYSYGMYVFHKPLHDLYSVRALKALGVPIEGMLFNASLHIAGLTAVSFAAAWLSYHLFEVHFLNLKRHFE